MGEAAQHQARGGEGKAEEPDALHARQEDLSFEAITHGANEASVSAANDFDHRQQHLTTSASHHYSRLTRRPMSRLTSTRYDSDLDRIRRNRFVIAEAAEEHEGPLPGAAVGFVP